MTAFRLGIVLLTVLVLQTELFSELRVFGVMPELLLGFTLAVAWNSGSAHGALAGFAAGLTYDLFLASPLGLNALSYTLVGHAVGSLSGGIADASANLARRVVSIAGVALGMLLFAILGELLLGDDLVNGGLVRLLVVSPLYTALMMPLLYRSTGWALATRSPAAPTRRRTSVLE